MKANRLEMLAELLASQAWNILVIYLTGPVLDAGGQLVEYQKKSCIHLRKQPKELLQSEPSSLTQNLLLFINTSIRNFGTNAKKVRYIRPKNPGAAKPVSSRTETPNGFDTTRSKRKRQRNLRVH